MQSLQKFETEAKKAIADLSELSKTHQVTVFCENEGETSRFVELMDSEQPGLKLRIELAVGYLHRGFQWQNSIGIPPIEKNIGQTPMILLGHHELFHRFEQRRRSKKVIASRPVDSFLDLKDRGLRRSRCPWHCPVHGHAPDQQGRARLKRYLTLAVCRTNATPARSRPRGSIMIQKYVGGFNGHPTLSRGWAAGRGKSREAKVGEAVMDMAAELLEVQAARDAEQGTPYPPRYRMAAGI